ncbi:MAG: hypothetical protein NT141_02705 [candidate division WWE3 bacterium]|nr:hypothetical protein [candidate division WWE3 bacterium]
MQAKDTLPKQIESIIRRHKGGEVSCIENKEFIDINKSIERMLTSRFNPKVVGSINNPNNNHCAG